MFNRLRDKNALLLLGPVWVSQASSAIAHSRELHGPSAQPEAAEPENPARPAEETSVEVVPTRSDSLTPGVSAKFSNGLPPGWGESIFCLIVLAPVLLLFWQKKRP